MPSPRHLLKFLFASLLLSGFIYRDAIWGGSLLAPLDLGPKLFTHYKFMDPEADTIPQNHHIIDQFTYDLPLQAAIHTAYRQGEIPWWDPYTYGGRPLLADAHVNGTDPVRHLCYRLLSFELAYNWNYILRGLLTGLGMFLLLSTLGVRALPAGILSVAYQFAGWYTLFFGHPWIQGSFAYFPFVWLFWSRAIGGHFARNTALAGLACGFVFYAGNLQSHTYLPLFSFAFLGTFAIGGSRALLLRSVCVCAVSGLIGALLAFPVLVNQVEFYLNSMRPLAADTTWYANLASIPFTLTSLYPWSVGTFRTLEITKLVGGAGSSFPLFFGAVGSFLAMMGAIHHRQMNTEKKIACRMAVFLVLIYLLIIATPLSSIFYSRSAGLAGMGLTVLAGIALQALLDGRLHLSKSWLRGFAVFMVAAALGSSCLAWFAYPHFKPVIERKMASGESASSYAAIPSISAMRTFQIDSFPKEVSIRNPEAAMTLLACLLFSFGLLRYSALKDRLTRDRLILVALAIGTLPVFMFHARFRPKHSIELWQRMQNGGNAQQKALSMARGGLRLDETSQPLSEMIFPNAMGAFYRIHCVQGYSALQPPSVFNYPPGAKPLAPSWRADLMITDSGISLTDVAEPTAPLSRFRRVDDGTSADVSILDETLNSLTLDVSRHDLAVPLVRTDTYYPGWHITSDASVEKFEPCFSKVDPILAESDESITLRYEPSMSRFFGYAMGSGILSFTILMLLPRGFRRKLEISGAGVDT